MPVNNNQSSHEAVIKRHVTPTSAWQECLFVAGCLVLAGAGGVLSLHFTQRVAPVWQLFWVLMGLLTVCGALMSGAWFGSLIQRWCSGSTNKVIPQALLTEQAMTQPKVAQWQQRLWGAPPLFVFGVGSVLAGWAFQLSPSWQVAFARVCFVVLAVMPLQFVGLVCVKRMVTWRVSRTHRQPLDWSSWINIPGCFLSLPLCFAGIGQLLHDLSLSRPWWEMLFAFLFIPAWLLIFTKVNRTLWPSLLRPFQPLSRSLTQYLANQPKGSARP